MLKKLLAGAVTLFCAVSANAITVTPSSDATALASAIGGSGISISGATLTGASGASGTFTDGIASGIGMESGIILSSGSAASVVGPNSSTATTTANGTPGDADLTALSGFSTFDANILSFDFEFDGGVGGDLYFNFVFGSEEYLEWVDSSFNDVFAFYLDGVNVATLPGGDPITINNVNNGDNPELFNDNTGGAFDNEMDGFTTVLSVEALGLSAGVHTMSFAIADAGDSILDSWVMIQADSFSNTPTTNEVPLPAALPMFLFGLASLLGMRRRAKNQTAA